ncbi:chromate transporter [Aminobacter ciceronei]|uniref:Chromate transporter n=1 Tax=Aminobacter ciceronei TaxID=150723 RepID=A0ABR6CEY8_9HYPH|nr:chromate transporter [Aminobacter ciceronei]MBA8909837.1 chromate transporter [Aminobacter ciceronei]MBA9023567.1 chromate transporter [Aminobacter ciceronei]
MTSIPDPVVEPQLLNAMRPAPGLGALFLACLKIGLLSFGGGLSDWLYQEFVLRNRWISDEDFASSLAISQMLPGANVVNLVICMGDDLRGLAGSIACVLGFLVGPFFAVIALSAVFDSLPDVTMLEAASNGVAYAALGLLLVICLKGVQRAMKFPPSLVVIAVVAIAVGLMKLPLIPVVLVVAPISVALAWRPS